MTILSEQEMLEIKVSRLNKISLSEFTTKYIPRILNNDESFVTDWVSNVSAHPYREVLLYNDKNPSDYILIPPVADSHLKILSPDDIKTINGNMHDYGRDKETFKGLAENSLAKGLKKINLIIGVSKEIEERWVDLLIKCGFEKEINLKALESKEEAPLDIDWIEID